MGSSTPSSKSNQSHQSKTPQSKRLNFHIPKPSPNPNSAVKEGTPAEHPVEVIGRIRDYPDRKDKPISALQISPDSQSVRVRTDIGYRDFTLDGVSLSEQEDLDGFYKKFVVSRINGVKLGAKCTIMMYGPTGSGKSHTMFGCAKQPGIVYKSLRDILGEENEESDAGEQRSGVRTFVQVTVLEIYNEEIYDLLSTNNGGGLSLGWSKGSASKVRLEVMGKKAKNAAFISGNEAGKISKEIQKVEKRRIVKSTLCNERSSRSHCMIILDVPTVGGQLMLVDMAGSENIEQAGQNGFEAKMQTGKINQGNIALKRVVESIANGDSHVPFRDSKLTMLLQDSFEDDKSKILMILCASPDPREIHKTISTLEYGAKAKCIVRGPHTPTKEKIGGEDSSSALILGSRIAAMDQFIFKLQMENKLREKERNEAHKELVKKEEEISSLRAKLEKVEVKGSGTSEEVINLKVNELLKQELEKKIQECQKMANEFVELERRKMEERIWQQQQEVEMLRRRLEEIESELYRSSNGNGKGNGSSDMDGSSFARRLLDLYAEDDPGMEKSMDLDKSMDLEISKQEPFVRDVKYFDGAAHKSDNNTNQAIWNQSNLNRLNNEEVQDVVSPTFPNKVSLSTVFEEGEELEDNEDKEKSEDEEVQKEVIEEKTVCSSSIIQGCKSGLNFSTGSFAPPSENFIATPIASSQKFDYFRDRSEEKHAGLGLITEPENAKDTASSRRLRIQNIFTLCGNYRELSQQNRTPIPSKKRFDEFAPVSSIDENALEPFAMNTIQDTDEIVLESKENNNPSNENTGDQLEVYIKWEAASKEKSGKFITTLKTMKNSTLADLRKLIEVHLGPENQAFTFLALGDPTGAPVPREKELTFLASKLPICNNQLQGHLACLRPVKGVQCPTHLPLSPLENKLPITPNAQHYMKQGDGFSPKVAQHLSSTPFITVRRY
ncbi:kinesin-like protein KIN-10A [Cornus florida]|uniref:kinesin-like protein KIN-10A n=1 Tax=Cornus florida TaxID=4283 RepID=UPI0028965312|nr:kinesin-like protein KIN-10A [Cornus florida]